MEIIITPSELFLFTWAVIATIGGFYQQHKSQHYHEQFRTLMKLACLITKDEKLRKDFESNVVDKLTDDKEVVFK